MISSASGTGGTITVDKSGKVYGLDDVPSPTRDEIARVLLTERLEPPAILKKLGAQDARLRGSEDDQPFKLLSPARTVVISNRPTLKWEQLARVTSYKVYVTDRAGNVVAKSDDLSSDNTSWAPPKPLKRGEIYTRTVVGVVDGKEVVSPGPAAPEMKFHVLSTNSLQRLNQLKRARSHLALGVFYAKVGMVSEAEREFQTLVKNHPRAEAAAKLLSKSNLGKGAELCLGLCSKSVAHHLVRRKKLFTWTSRTSSVLDFGSDSEAAACSVPGCKQKFRMGCLDPVPFSSLTEGP